MLVIEGLLKSNVVSLFSADDNAGLKNIIGEFASVLSILFTVTKVVICSVTPLALLWSVIMSPTLMLPIVAIRTHCVVVEVAPFFIFAVVLSIKTGDK